MSQRERLVSVDALRGFDMFWIIGADALVGSLKHISDAPWVQLIVTQLEHAEWEGFRFYDLIFPLFVFLVGLSSVFSLGRIDRELGRQAAYERLARRAILLYLLGLFYYGGLPPESTTPMFRYVGVLQRLAICYFFAGLIFLNLRWKGILATTVLLLVGYWVLLMWIPGPGFAAGALSEPGQNWTHYVDQHYLPGYKWDGQWDPEGLLSHIPAVASALLGVLAGLVLRDESFQPWRRVGLFVAAGVGCLVLGYLWGLQFPIIKKLWTSSYVLVAGGWSLLLLALFYVVIDIYQYRTWAQPFVWIGLNPIAVYMATGLVNPNDLVRRVIHSDVEAAMAPYGELVVSLLGLSLAVGFCYWLYQRRIFIRI
ncbi:MAG: hypothetical protein U0795_02795 [Pirellulales bacterium]